MDKHTKQAKICIEERFKTCDANGVYYALEPIYGFRKGHSEPGLDRYIRIYQIIKALSHLRFDFCLDAGGGDGYTAHIVKKLFETEVKSCDLSEEASRRSRDIFGVESITCDMHCLPFGDEEFDVVLCSETLEHVVDFRKAIYELLRVAKNAVVITVPHESIKVINKNIKNKTPHGHIHNFSLKSFNFLISDGCHVFSRKIVSPLLRIPAILIEAMPREYNRWRKHPKLLIDIYNSSIPIFRRIFGKRTAVFLVRLDNFICKFTPFYKSIVCIVLKDKESWTKNKNRRISVNQILNFTVPYYYLK